MKNFRLLHAENSRHFELAEAFVLPKEKKYMALMMRIQNHEDSVYLIEEFDLEKHIGKIAGVFSYNKGRAFTPCIPDFSEPVVEILKNFLKDRDIFCLVGDVNGVNQIEKIVYELHGKKARDKRELFLMEFQSKKLKLKNTEGIIVCKKSDIHSVMPLHLKFMREEVLPSWHKIIPAAELLSVERAVKKFHMVALERDGKLVAKAQTNAETKKYIQIGGVYTLKEYRNNGYAKVLVSQILRYALENKKGCVLYVRQENEYALSAYESSGFFCFDEMKMIYF